jgi:hypothetical protein
MIRCRFSVLAVLALALCCAAWTRGTTALTVGDIAFVDNVPYSGFMFPSDNSTGPHVNQLSYYPATLPNGTTITWSYPSNPCGAICGFLQQAYGDYNNGPTNYITPQQISTITTLTSSANLTFGVSNTSDGWDVIDDIFLGTTDHAIDALEIEIFQHSPTSAQSFCAGGASKGTLVDGGITWNVSVISGSTPDACFIPSNFADVTSTTIDIKAMFLYLVSQSVIPNTVWYHGHAKGIEPRNGSGYVTYNSWSMVYN